MKVEFKNEIMSEEDIKIHGLDKLMERFDGWAWRNGRPSVFQHSWTVNESRDVFLVKVSTINEVGPSGRSEPTNKNIFILNNRGAEHEVLLEKLNDSSSSFSDSPFRIHWEVLSVQPFDYSDKASKAELLSLLICALQIYGHRGALRQIPDTIVEVTSTM